MGSVQVVDTAHTVAYIELSVGHTDQPAAPVLVDTAHLAGALRRQGAGVAHIPVVAVAMAGV